MQAYGDATGSFERRQLAEQSATKTRENSRLTQRVYSLAEVDLQTLLLSRRRDVEAADSALDARVLDLRSVGRCSPRVWARTRMTPRTMGVFTHRAFLARTIGSISWRFTP